MSNDFAKEAERHKPRRRNKDTRKAVEIAASGEVDAATETAPDQPWMEPDDSWAPEVKYIFVGMQQSVMAQFMTPVDWAQLYTKCSAWSKEFKRKFLGIAANGDIKFGHAPVPASVLADMQRTLDGFGGSEKARRDMKILVDPNPDGVKAAQAGDAKMAARKAIARPSRGALGQ